MDKTVISIMLFPSMFACMTGIMLAGALANLSSGNRSGSLPSTISDDLVSYGGWGLIREMLE